MSKFKVSKNVKWGGYLNNNKLTSNKKYIVLLLIFLIGFLTIYINTSYGLFKKKDYLTSIDFVAGTLDYKIENVELENNSITLAAGSERKLTLTLTSLNQVDSKYELYYLINGEKVDNPDIEIGYTNESVDSVKGTISANDTKEITVSIKNNGNEAVNITLGCEGGLINNELVMAKGNSLDKLILSDDLIVAYTYVGEETAPERFPNKGEGYIVKNVTCNGMDAEWNNITWSLAFSNVTGKNITCNFEIDDGTLATDFVMNLAKTNIDELRIDEHAATGQQNFVTKEYRYYGKTPNNYVWFNNELWRIIGVFDVDDGSNAGSVGNVEKRLKIIRNESIGNYSWDSSDLNTNKGSGVNEWTQADLMNLLNLGAYYNRTTGTCYTSTNNVTTSCDFSATSTTPGLTSEAKEMIGNAKWYLGAGVESFTTFTAANFYTNERGTNTGKQCIQDANYCSDSVTRKTYWTGQIGLMYPSDYGYSANMTSCSSTALYSYSTLCKNSTWLFNSANHQWTLSPRPYSSYAHIVFGVYSNGNLNGFHADALNIVLPVTYLLPSIKIIDGIGTDTQPYILSK